MTYPRAILICLGALIALLFVFPHTIGSTAAEIHSAYKQTMQERGAEAYRRRNQ